MAIDTTLAMAKAAAKSRDLDAYDGDADDEADDDDDDDDDDTSLDGKQRAHSNDNSTKHAPTPDSDTPRLVDDLALQTALYGKKTYNPCHDEDSDDVAPPARLKRGAATTDDLDAVKLSQCLLFQIYFLIFFQKNKRFFFCLAAREDAKAAISASKAAAGKWEDS